MRKHLLIWMLICLYGTEYVHAQWTKKDSVWLQDVLSGKEKLQLNTETMKAIESGNLINMDKPASEMKMAPPVAPLPILKDFSEYVQSDDSTRRKIALKDLPYSVFRLYGPDFKKIPSVYQSVINGIKASPLPRGGSSLNVGISLAFDIGDMTSRKTHVHRRNVKRDGTWKEYNNLPTPDIIKKRKNFVKEHSDVSAQDSILKTDSIQKADTSRLIRQIPLN